MQLIRLIDNTDFYTKSNLIFEQRGIGFYDYQKEIEVILQVLKQNLKDKKKYQFDINQTNGCNIPLSKSLLIQVDHDFNGDLAEYIADKNDTDDNNQTNPNFDYNTNQFNESIIQIHIPDNGDFDESLYRSTISHELNHLRDDHAITAFAGYSLKDVYQKHSANISKIREDLRTNKGCSAILYRIYIPTELSALASEVYSQLWSRARKSDYQVTRKMFYEIDAYHEFEYIRDKFNFMFINNPTGPQSAIVYFDKWNEPYLNIQNAIFDLRNKLQDSTLSEEEQNKNRYLLEKLQKQKEELLQKFKTWFTISTDRLLKKLYRKMLMAADLFFTEYENRTGISLDYDDILKLSSDVKISLIEDYEFIRNQHEYLNTEPKTEFSVKLTFEDNSTKTFKTKYDPKFLNAIPFLK